MIECKSHPRRDEDEPRGFYLFILIVGITYLKRLINHRIEAAIVTQTIFQVNHNMSYMARVTFHTAGRNTTNDGNQCISLAFSRPFDVSALHRLHSTAHRTTTSRNSSGVYLCLPYPSDTGAAVLYGAVEVLLTGAFCRCLSACIR